MTRYRALGRRGFLLPRNLKTDFAGDFEGAGTGRRSLGWDDYGVEGGAGLLGLPLLRRRSRRVIRNDAYASGGVSSLVSNAIGTGIVPTPQHSDSSIRTALHELWDDWVIDADADGVLDFYGLQTLVARTVFGTGECFIRLRTRRLEDGLAVPLQLQVLGPEYVPFEKNEQTGARTIRNGIEFDPIGRRVAYHIYKCHPGDAGCDTQTVRVPASEVIHVFEPLEAGQIRGTPVLTPVLLRIHSLDRFDDAVLFRQQVANLFTGFIRKPAEEDSPLGDDGQPLPRPAYDDQTPTYGLEPGTMQELLPGEEVEFTSPPDAGNAYSDFMRQQLQAVAAGLQVPYELLTGDYRQVNDRIMRVALNEFRRRIEQKQFNIFVHQMCRRVRNHWLDMAVLAGAIDLPDYKRDIHRYRRTRWVPQGWAYINPVQDVAAKRAEVRAGFTSRTEVVMRNGYNAELIDSEQQTDNQRADFLGLKYDTDSRQRDNVGKAQPDFVEENNDQN